MSIVYINNLSNHDPRVVPDFLSPCLAKGNFNFPFFPSFLLSYLSALLETV